MENIMNDSSRPIITEDEVRALNFTPEDILEIEKVILSLRSCCTSKGCDGSRNDYWHVKGSR